MPWEKILCICHSVSWVYYSCIKINCSSQMLACINSSLRSPAGTGLPVKHTPHTHKSYRVNNTTSSYSQQIFQELVFSFLPGVVLRPAVQTRDKEWVHGLCRDNRQERLLATCRHCCFVLIKLCCMAFKQTPDKQALGFRVFISSVYLSPGFTTVSVRQRT